MDETDRYQDNRTKKSARRTSSAEIMKGIIERERRRIASVAISESGSPRLTVRWTASDLSNALRI